MYKVLSVGFDGKLFDTQSESYSRQKLYSSWLKKLTILDLTKTKNVKFIKDGNLEISSIRSFKNIFESTRIIRQQKYDLITTQDPFICGLVGVLIKFFLRVPLNIQIHTEAFNSDYFRNESLKNRIFYHLGLLILRFADSVRGRDQKIIADILTRFPILKGKVAYVGAPLQATYFEKYSNTEREDNLLVANGRLVKQKNYQMCLDAIAILRKENPLVRLAIVGVGPEERKIRSMIDERNLKNSVSLLGWQEPTKFKKLLDKASAFILSSNHEGWALVVIEALLRGTPVVMTDTGCAGEIVINEKTGIVTPVGDSKKFAEAIAKVLRNRQKYELMARKGRVLVQRDVNPVKLKKDLLKMYALTTS